MNLVGKIFTVLIFVMSLVFMTFSTMVYSTHRNWREEVTGKDGWQARLDKAKSDNKDLKDKNEALNKQYNTEVAREQKVRIQAENENKDLRDERAKNEKKIQELDSALRAAVAAMDATQKQLAVLRTDNETLRVDIEKAETARDDEFKKVVKLTDNLNNAVNQRVQLEKRMQELLQQLAEYKALAAYWKLNPKNFKGDPPAGIEGIVTAVTSPDMVEISIGSDDGVLKGHKFEVVRMGGGSATYVGRIEVLQVTPDRAACRVDKKLQQSPMQRGDRVLASLSAIR